MCMSACGCPLHQCINKKTEAKLVVMLYYSQPGQNPACSNQYHRVSTARTTEIIKTGFLSTNCMTAVN